MGIKVTIGTMDGEVIETCVSDQETAREYGELPFNTDHVGWVRCETEKE